ncbi:MAG: pyridoxal-phosphate dependent enzyme [Gemmatimonadetes bacterium]|nr:pyridoxal-phosphate dependent enzyme [Gemmatimonadota bacterium]
MTLVTSDALRVSALVGRSSIEDAHRALEGVAVRTPLLPAQWLSDEVGATVRLKCENLQRAGAFKIRGAYTAVARLSDTDRARGVIAYSSGNHAQGVALAAKLFGIRAVVVMPTTSPEVKRAGARSFGAEVVLEGTTSIDRQKRAEAIAAEQGLTIIPAFDDADIIAGQGTTAIEILDDWPDVETILVPIGGGGLISGIAAWVKQTRPEIRVIGVEPRTADAMRQSLAAGEPVTIPPATTVADGLMPVRPGDLTFLHAREYVDDIVIVDDDAILDATRRLLKNSKLVVEFSGAATVAALLSRVFDPRGSQVAAVLSGGNIDPVRALELLV